MNPKFVTPAVHKLVQSIEKGSYLPLRTKKAVKGRMKYLSATTAVVVAEAIRYKYLIQTPNQTQ